MTTDSSPKQDPTRDKKRLVYLDFLKTIAIFLVCYYHSKRIILGEAPHPLSDHWDLVAYLVQTLAVMAVPLFFMVNGALTLNKPLDFAQHLKKTVKLFFVMEFWILISTVIIMRSQGVTPRLSQLVEGQFLLQVGYSHHLWFLRTLIMIYLLHPLIKLAYDHSDRRYLYLLLAVVFVFAFGQNALNAVVDFARAVSGKDLYGGREFPIGFDINPFGGYFYSLLYYIVGGLFVRNDIPRIANISKIGLVGIFLVGWFSLFFYGLVKSHLIGENFDTVFSCYSSIMALLMAISCFALAAKNNIGDERLFSFTKKNRHWNIGDIFNSSNNKYGPEIVFAGYDYVFFAGRDIWSDRLRHFAGLRQSRGFRVTEENSIRQKPGITLIETSAGLR